MMGAEWCWSEGGGGTKCSSDEFMAEWLLAAAWSAKPWRVFSSCSDNTNENGEFIMAIVDSDGIGEVMFETVLDRDRDLVVGSFVREIRFALPPVPAAAAAPVPDPGEPAPVAAAAPRDPGNTIKPVS